MIKRMTQPLRTGYHKNQLEFSRLKIAKDLTSSGPGPHPKSFQSCPTLYDSIDHSPPGPCVHGILQVGEYLRELPFPSSGDVPDPGIEPMTPELADRFFVTEPSRKPPTEHISL